jgi:hypothetical protein
MRSRPARSAPPGVPAWSAANAPQPPRHPPPRPPKPTTNPQPSRSSSPSANIRIRLLRQRNQSNRPLKFWLRRIRRPRQACRQQQARQQRSAKRNRHRLLSCLRPKPGVHRSAGNAPRQRPRRHLMSSSARGAKTFVASAGMIGRPVGRTSVSRATRGTNTPVNNARGASFLKRAVSRTPRASRASRAASLAGSSGYSAARPRLLRPRIRSQATTSSDRTPIAAAGAADVDAISASAVAPPIPRTPAHPASRNSKAATPRDNRMVAIAGGGAADADAIAARAIHGPKGSKVAAQSETQLILANAGCSPRIFEAPAHRGRLFLRWT